MISGLLSVVDTVVPEPVLPANGVVGALYGSYGTHLFLRNLRGGTNHHYAWTHQFYNADGSVTNVLFTDTGDILFRDSGGNQVSLRAALGL